jgi:hypothetical protein
MAEFRVASAFGCSKKQLFCTGVALGCRSQLQLSRPTLPLASSQVPASLMPFSEASQKHDSLKSLKS